MVEGGTLLRCCAGNPRTAGSNPALSAKDARPTGAGFSYQGLNLVETQSSRTQPWASLKAKRTR